MELIHVVCTVAILLSPNNRSVVDLHGDILQEIGDNYLVDFTKEFTKKHYSTDLQSMAFEVNSNNCLFSDPKQVEKINALYP